MGLFTDFGWNGPYVGQMSALLVAQGIPHFHLQHDVPAFDTAAGGTLLTALCRYLPEPTLLVAVVDPGVGGERKALLVRSANHWFIGPDNGLLGAAIRQYGGEVEEILWRPCRLSESFHGRDLFVPAAAKLLQGEAMASRPVKRESILGIEGDDDLPRIVYLDHYGNLVTGIRANSVEAGASLVAAGRRIFHSRTFCAAAEGEPFWYANSIGLVELAVNRGRADRTLGLAVGDPVRVEMPPEIGIG